MSMWVMYDSGTGAPHPSHFFGGEENRPSGAPQGYVLAALARLPQGNERWNPQSRRFEEPPALVAEVQVFTSSPPLADLADKPVANWTDLDRSRVLQALAKHAGML